MCYVGPFYPKIIVFYVLDHRGNLVFSLLLGYINRILDGCDSLLLLLAFIVFLRIGLVSQD
jgi:hypothetical protein